MELNRAILVFALAAAITLSALPCSGAQKDKDKGDIWAGDELRGPGPGPRPGPGPGPGPGRGPGRWGARRFELTDEEIDRLMKGLKESDPVKAKELAKLRNKDPEKFREELRRHGHGHEEFGKIITERIEHWRKTRQAEFLKWLEKPEPREVRELAKLKETNPNLYTEKFELLWKKYGRIFEERRRNPELAEVLLEDLELQKRRDELLRKIKLARNEKEKKELATELEEVVARRFDLIVRQKQIAYERLLRWLEDLRERVKESRGEMAIWRSDEFKNENVKKRIQELLEEAPQFRWH